MTIQNGAGTPVVPQVKTNEAPASTPAAPDIVARLAAIEKERDEYRQKVERAEKKVRINEIEMRKFSDEKKGIGAKLSAHDKMSKALEAAGLTVDDLLYSRTNFEPVAKKILGDNWYDKVVEMKINGGAISADAVAAELERAKNDIRNEFAQKAEQEKAEAERLANERAQQARQQLTEEAAGFLEKNWSEYPIFEGNDKLRVAQALASYIESEYHRTGKVLTNKEAADALEGAELARAERLAGIEKYKTKLTEKLKPATVSTSGAPLQRRTEGERRTLSNDLTASTPGQKRTSRTDEERMQAILAMRFGER